MSVSISNSEVAAWLSCQRKWFYAHSLNIKPKQYSEALNRGIIGHEALAEYYMNGYSPEAGRLKVMEYYPKGDVDEKKMLLKLLSLLDRYYEIDPFRDWKIKAVEQQYDVPLTDRYAYSMRLDLLARDPADGFDYLVDHKFVYDFWQQVAFDLNAQFPKYLVALNQNGYNVRGVVVNQLRHRVDPDKAENDALFKVKRVYPDRIEKERIFREHLQASDQIADMKDKPLEAQKENVLRNMSMTVCRNCSFQDLCKTELVGSDATLLIKNFYEPNTYGYNNGDSNE